MVIPDEAGIGQAPQSFAKAASERIRSGLSPKRINISAAVWAPTPKPSRRVGDVSVVSRANPSALSPDRSMPCHRDLGRIPPLRWTDHRRRTGLSPAHPSHSGSS